MSTDAGAAAGGRLLNGRYQVTEPASEGLFFTSVRAGDNQTGRQVVIKFLKDEFAADHGLVTRLITESDAARRLADSGIVQTYSAWRDGPSAVISSEYIRGISLRERIDRVAPFPLAVAIEIAHSIALALAYANDNGFVHGDLRPDNVLITPDGRVKLADFGVGIAVAESARVQLTSLAPAAPYVAPEMIEGHAPDARSDIYALGCILHEMLSGKPPFLGSTPVATAAQHLKEPPPSLLESRPDIPNAVDGLVRKCIQKEPMQRYVSAHALLADIRRIREGLRNGDSLDWTPLVSQAEMTAPRPRNRRRHVRADPVEEHDGGPSPKVLAVIGMLFFLLSAGAFFAISNITATPPEVVVPSGLVGAPEAAARQEIEQAGLKAEVRREYSSKVEQGRVVRVSPPSGAEMRAGKIVTLLVSRGPEPVEVPDLIGKSREAALEDIRAAGLAPGDIEESYSGSVPAGEVMAQLPLAGGRAGKGSPIRLVVSKGPEPELQPALDLEEEGEDDSDDEASASVEPAESEDSPPTPGDSRSHVVTVEIPDSSSGTQFVQIIVRHSGGREETVHDQGHEPGATVEQTVNTTGPRGQSEIRVYINGKLYQRFGV